MTLHTFCLNLLSCLTAVGDDHARLILARDDDLTWTEQERFTVDFHRHIASHDQLDFTSCKVRMLSMRANSFARDLTLRDAMAASAQTNPRQFEVLEADDLHVAIGAALLAKSIVVGLRSRAPETVVHSLPRVGAGGVRGDVQDENSIRTKTKQFLVHVASVDVKFEEVGDVAKQIPTVEECIARRTRWARDEYGKVWTERVPTS